MAQSRLLQAVCTAALLAAAPAFAQQTTTPPAGAAPTAPAAHDGTMAPGGKMGSMDGTGSSMGHHRMHRSAMRDHSTGAMHGGRSDTSQDAVVDQLNNQSYQAAQQGQAFSSAGSGGMMAPAGGGSPATDASGAGGGTGSK